MVVGITGANGFVGKVLLTHLSELNHRPVAITRKPMASSSCINNVVPNFGNLDELSHAFRGCEVVVILAALTHSEYSVTEENLARYRAQNLDTAQMTIEAAKISGVRRIIYLSSIKVLGESTTGAPFSVDAIPQPEDAYGMTKYETELMLREKSDKYGIELVIIRSPLVYGPEVKGNIKRLKHLIEKGVPLPFGSIRNRRDLVALPTLCDLIAICLEHSNAPGQIFLVSDGHTRSTPEIIKMLFAEETIKPILLPFPINLLRLLGRLTGRTEEIQRLTGDLEIDISHTCKTLNWRPPGLHSDFPIAE